MSIRCYMNWSGGKDSALSLHRMRQNRNYSIDRLLTTINMAHQRISMHGVRRELLERQAEAINIPLDVIELPEQPSMTEYEELMREKVLELKNEGLATTIFGDIFLEDLKNYRVEQLDAVGIDCIFPLWQLDSRQLMNEFIALEFKAVVVCVNESFLDKSFCGRPLDAAFLRDLPAGVDPCGENGEYHSFVYDGPIFKQPVRFVKGEIVRKVYRSPKVADSNNCPTDTEPEYGFYFCDLLA